MYHGTPSNVHGSMYQLELFSDMATSIGVPIWYTWRWWLLFWFGCLIHMAKTMLGTTLRCRLWFVYPDSGAKTSPERRAETNVAINSDDESILQWCKTSRLEFVCGWSICYRKEFCVGSPEKWFGRCNLWMRVLRLWYILTLLKCP